MGEQITDQVIRIPDEVNYIVFRNGIRVKHREEIGFTSDGRLVTIEYDRVGKILGIALI